jgi:hypothetical protein
MKSKLNKHETLHLQNSPTSPDDNTYSQIEAFDTDGDLDTTERWILTVPEESVFRSTLLGKGGRATALDSEFSIPFTITIDLAP